MPDQPEQEQPGVQPPADGAKDGAERPSRPPGPRVSRGWHQTRATPDTKKTQAKSQRKRTIFILLACILALLGVIAAWLFFIHPFHAPQLISFALTEYRSDLYPVNAFALHDSAALRAHFEGAIDAHDNQAKQQLEDRLDGFLKKATDSALVVHLSGFARVNNGTLFLLPADARPGDPTSWLAMDEVLRRLRDCKAPHKLLILDIFRSLDDPRRGTLPDDIAGAFRDLFTSRSQGKLLVLCACSPGQLSLVSEELAQSVFGYYLDQGLRGHADGYNAERKLDGRIKVRELAAYVRARVERWAMRNRGLHQTPELLGDDKDDFDLVSLERGEKKLKESDDPLPPYPTEIQAGWKIRDEWLADRSAEYAPRAVARLEALLLRQEQRWRGHGNLDEIKQAVKANLDDLKSEVQKSRPPQPAELYSLILKNARSPIKISPEARSAVSKALEDVGPETKAPVLTMKQAEFAKAFEKLKTKPSFEEVAWTVLRVVLGDDAPCTEKAQLQLVLDILKDYPGSTSELAELVFLQRLAAFKPDEKGWPKDRIIHLLRLYQEGEKAHTCRPREFPWVRHALDAAVAKRLEGEKLFFAADSDNFGKVRELWDDALQKYSVINEQVAAVRRAQHARDEALRLLPAYLPCLVAQYRLDDQSRLPRAWSDALRAARELSDFLASPPGDKAPTGEEMEEVREKLNADASRLEKHLGLAGLGEPLRDVKPEKVIEAAGPEDEEGAVQRTIRALLDADSILATPWPSAAQRGQLWKNRRIFAENLHKKVRLLDEADDDAERPTPAPSDAAEKSASRQQAERAFRAQLSVQLLTVAGLAKEAADPIRKDMDKALAAKADAKAWNALAGRLSRAWSEQLPDQLTKITAREDLTSDELAAGDRLLRVIDPLMGVTIKKSPTAILRGGEARQYWKWLGAYYQKQALALTGQPALQKVLQQAASEFAASAE
jgi:hypothetical protein